MQTLQRTLTLLLIANSQVLATQSVYEIASNIINGKLHDSAKDFNESPILSEETLRAKIA